MAYLILLRNFGMTPFLTFLTSSDVLNQISDDNFIPSNAAHITVGIYAFESIYT